MSYSKLMDISERIKNGKSQVTKMNIIDSLKVFQARNIQLNIISLKYDGFLLWFNSRDIDNSSSNIEVFSGSSSLGALCFDPPNDIEVEDTQEVNTAIIAVALKINMCRCLYLQF